MQQEPIKLNGQEEATPFASSHRQHLAVAFLSLFGSMSTLICCALPVLLVTLGFGATLVGLTTNLPWLITLSMHKEWVFTGSLVMLSLAGMMVYRARNLPCPIDPLQRKVCLISRRASVLVITTSFILWGLGFSVAFLAPLIY